MRCAPVIPVLVLDGQVDPVALAETLVEAGLPVIEVTLRTPSALDAIRRMRTVEGAIIGAGTVLSAAMMEQAIGAGAQFAVSPGLLDGLVRMASERDLPYLPGVANATDLMIGIDLGLDRFKFFPAESSGGIAALSALAGPFLDARFCPTGGITAETASAWLARTEVLCVGGSWIIRAGETDLAVIFERARAAAALGE
ncbi:bifunctional 4-hydroxy-2-oxoglutarate aldolase/2-dehydro-3-deoxy-phosphogluconate aldolase [Sphingomonas xanthus]|uniref:2-dehydro-3-deoxy-phosphogluconate aldolase n=1 Tax=Sphingomonas xanthus TaxID=2594473 RepID=A0A516IUL7_9SPHN|nr:bifunctional 4-hydroxy-2-oxoglutarate aldolase/2-dehydro-3-deoxy-phosphogluconate aldolase [Sphingomonas xanthus]QDP20575.1 bifunctional 4-hydroxy-2-oxoglutarate aldolase/2-dehydro-3-deoxy-phosphogluconate aldolase [Sphingomonas xanthus]